MPIKMPGANKKKQLKFVSHMGFKKGLSLSPDATISAYLKEISGFNPLTREEEGELGRKIAQGDDKALKKLVKHNLKFVVSIANMYCDCGVSVKDLINEGNIGIIKAAQKFDPAKKVKFITYASWWVRQSIMRAIANSSTVRIPAKPAGLKETETNGQESESIVRFHRPPISFNNPMRDITESSYHNAIQENDSPALEADMIKEDLNSGIKELLKELPKRDVLILKLRFGFDGPPQTLDEIGKMFKLSRERVRQIEKKAKNKLWRLAKTKSL